MERGEAEMVPGQGEMERLQPGRQESGAIGTQELVVSLRLHVQGLIQLLRDLGHGDPADRHAWRTHNPPRDLLTHHSEVDPFDGTTGTDFLVGYGAVPISGYHAARAAVCCCFWGCGHVGNALALSIMSTARAVIASMMPSHHTAIGVA